MQLEALHRLVGEWTTEVGIPGQDAPIAGRTSGTRRRRQRPATILLAEGRVRGLRAAPARAGLPLLIENYSAYEDIFTRPCRCWRSS